MTKPTCVSGPIRIIKVVWEKVGLAALASLMISMPLAKATAEDVPWSVSAAAIRRVTLKSGTHFPQLPLDSAKASAVLDSLRAEGISAVEIFALADGGRSFGGLDHKDLFRIDPELGTMDDFRRLVKLIHEKAMPVVAFVNLGYSSVDAPEFLKARDDVKAGVRPAKRVCIFGLTLPMLRLQFRPRGHRLHGASNALGSKPGTFYNSEKDEFWQWSERAGKLLDQVGWCRLEGK